LLSIQEGMHQFQEELGEFQELLSFYSYPSTHIQRMGKILQVSLVQQVSDKHHQTQELLKKLSVQHLKRNMGKYLELLHQDQLHIQELLGEEEG